MEKTYSEAEIQVLIALAELADPYETPNNIGYSFNPQTLDQAASYFRRFREDWSETYHSLADRGLVQQSEGGYNLTLAGLAEARRLRLERPPIYYWYKDFYRQAAASPANAEFSRRVYGLNLCQQGFMTMADLQKLIKETRIGPGDRVLDLGCGNGMIAEYISDTTRAQVWGMDYVPEAIEQAQQRTQQKRERLHFKVGNLDQLDYPRAAFDVILAVDTLYMPNDLEATLRQMIALMVPGGRMGIYYSYDLWENPQGSREWLQPQGTPLGRALINVGLSFETWNFTESDYQHALQKRAAAVELGPAFAAEGNQFLHEIRAGEAEGVASACEQGIHARYLYVATC